jgi:hypothetical protein
MAPATLIRFYRGLKINERCAITSGLRASQVPYYSVYWQMQDSPLRGVLGNCLQLGQHFFRVARGFHVMENVLDFSVRPNDERCTRHA